MITHQLTLLKPDKRGRTKIEGVVSRLDYKQATVYLLEANQVGMVGKDGTPYPFDSLAGVQAETSPGRFEGELLLEWLAYGRTLREK